MNRPAHLHAITPAKPARDELTDAQRTVDEIASRRARQLEAMLCDLVEFAEGLAGADAIRNVGVREIARQTVTLNRPLALNLQAINARKP